METVMKSDIFFFITTICVVALSVLIGIAVFYLIKILKDLKIISKEVKEEGHMIIEDARDMRESFKKNGNSLLKALFAFILGKKTKKHKNKN